MNQLRQRMLNVYTNIMINIHIQNIVVIDGKLNMSTKTLYIKLSNYVTTIIAISFEYVLLFRNEI